MPRQLRVFLCHASQDKPAVRELYKRLKAENWIDPWLDEEKLSFGQHWTTTIEDALSEADVVLIFLSKNSVQKEGFVQRELNYAWELSLEKPRNVIFLIPFRLDDCQIPRYLGSRQWGDYFGEKKESTYQTLLRSLKQRHQQKLQLEVEESTALKQADINSIERELRNKWEQEQKEKAAKENAELLAQANLKRELAQKKLVEFREKEERDSKAKAAREKAKQENEKPQTTERTIAEKKREEVNNSAPKRDLRFLGVVGVILIALIMFGLSTFMNNPPVENVVKENTATLTPTKVSIETKTSIPVTSTSITVSTISVTATPVLEIGSTMISEKDGMVMVYVPAGEFIMGIEIDDALTECEKYDNCQREWFVDLGPEHLVVLDSFWIDQTEITNSMYSKCVADGGCTYPVSIQSDMNYEYYGNSIFNDYPLININWFEASNYCNWAGRTLPTEAQWEKAARGPFGSIYPWGNTFNGKILNFCDINCPFLGANENFNDNHKDVAPVGSYPNGVSFYGAYDMSGNVGEWVLSLYRPYPYNALDGREDLYNTEDRRTLRSGSWDSNEIFTTSAMRSGSKPTDTNTSVGFRCAMDASP